MKKVVIIGAGHAGLTAARILLRSGRYEVIIYERGDCLGFVNGSYSLWLKGQIKNKAQTFFTNQAQMQEMGAIVYLNTEVYNVDHIRKSLSIRDEHGQLRVDNYDKLILSTGSRSSEFPIPGMDLAGIHYAKFFKDAESIIHQFEDPKLRRVAIIGGSYIGLELAEACHLRGKEVILIEPSGQLLTPHYDRIFAERMYERLIRLGINIEYARVQRFVGTGRVSQIVTSKSVQDVQLVLINAGFYPVAPLCEQAERIENLAYKVNSAQQTSLSDIYAIGDCSASYDKCLGEHRSSFFASNAIRTGTISAKHIMGQMIERSHTQNTTALLIQGFYMASTGTTVTAAKARKMDVSFSDFKARQFHNFMSKQNQEVDIRLIYRKSDRVLIGAQLCSEYDISEHINYYSLAVQEELTISELAFGDLFFMPHFNQVYGYQMLCALGAS